MSSAVPSEPLPQYRSISALAILALLLGLASPLSLATPLLLVVAVAAAGVAVIALRQIAADSEVLSGRTLALIALFLAMFFLIYTPARLWLRYRVVEQRAQELTVAFLDLLQAGKMSEAHQLAQLKYVSPDPTAMLSGGSDPNELNAEDLRKFEESRSIANIKQLDRKFTYRFSGAEPSADDYDSEYLVLRYQIVPDPVVGKPPFPVWITVSRKVDAKTGMPTWKMREVRHQPKK